MGAATYPYPTAASKRDRRRVKIARRVLLPILWRNPVFRFGYFLQPAEDGGCAVGGFAETTAHDRGEGSGGFAATTTAHRGLFARGPVFLAAGNARSSFLHGSVFGDPVLSGGAPVAVCDFAVENRVQQGGCCRVACARVFGDANFLGEPAIGDAPILRWWWE